MDILLPRFVSECDIHKECSIDEAMIPFKGRLGFKQYMKDKPTKWGIKVFVLADSHNGYVKTLQVYTGKGLEADGSSSDIGLCTKVCLDLMEGVDAVGLELYTDNYYTSPTLYQYIYDTLQVTACGTCRPNRVGFPIDELKVKATKHNRGHCDYLSKGPLVACSWVDKRSIYFVTTVHVGELPSGGSVTVKRKEADGSLVDRTCPPCMPDYQAYMRGVDRGDQSRSYYTVGRRSKKWWRRLFFYLVECCMLNAYVLEGYVKTAEHAKEGWMKRDVLSFRRELQHLLIHGYSSRKLPGRPRSAPHAQLTRLQPNHLHWPTTVPQSNDCVVCAGKTRRKNLPSRGNRHETRFICKHCKVHLCVASGRDCFEEYHTKMDYCA